MGFGFTGEVTDASGLVYLRARYYVPELGVFPNLDPVEEGNRYGYVGGNVVNRVDPSGTCPEEVRAAGRAVAGLAELAPGIDLGPDGELVFENAACAAYYGFAQVPLQVIDKARDIAKATPILYGAKASYEAARLATAAVGAGTLVLGGAVVAIPVLMLIIAGSASVPSPYTEEMLETMRNRYPRLNNQPQSWSASEDVPHPQPQPLRAPQPPDQGNCSNNSDQDRERHYYFRGTSVGYPGNESLQQLRITPVSTQPGVATAFAVESKRFGEGIVYIASKHDLTGILITPGSVLAQLEHEMAVHLLPLEFAARASVNTSPEASRKILVSMGVHIPATIYSKSDISSILAQNRVLTDAEITIFVGRVRLEDEQ